MLALGFSARARAQDAPAEALEIRVEGIRPAGGEIGVAVFSTKKGYPIQIEYALESQWVPIQKEQTAITVTFDTLAPGEYAVSLLHDENGNRKLETSVVGFPKEGVGFSSGCKVTLHAPRYKKCKFTFAAGELKKLSIMMDYRHASPIKSQPAPQSGV